MWGAGFGTGSFLCLLAWEAGLALEDRFHVKAAAK